MFGLKKQPKGKLPEGEKRKGLAKIAILYRLSECGDVMNLADLSRQYQELEPLMQEMFNEDLLTIDGQNWGVGTKGKELLGKLVQMTDLAMRFEIFSSVDLQNCELSDELSERDEQGEHTGQCVAWEHDPRFNVDPNVGEDLRLAMFAWMSVNLKEQLPGGIDPYQIVFLQKLGSGQYKEDTFWFNLMSSGVVFDEITGIIEHAYRWRDMWPNDEAAASQYMQGLYTAGMTESRKLNGDSCSKCGCLLALYDDEAAADGVELESCPKCEHVFGSDDPSTGSGQAGGGEAELACPYCDATIYPGDRNCSGCGAQVDHSLRAGTAVEETEEIVEESYDVCGWSDGWGYEEPYPFYDPYDPFLDAAAFAVLAEPVYYDPVYYDPFYDPYCY